MAQIELQLSLPRDARYVSLLRRISESLLRGLEVPAETVDDVSVALSEACGNVIRHAEGTDEYGIRLTVGSTICEVEVCDLGPGFDRKMLEEAERVPSIDAVDGAEDGRGLPLLRALVDDLQFVREDETTTVRLIKRWDGLVPL
jgi:serine/threonine-protein kinase RsbW